MKTALYARVSTRDKQTPQNQLDQLRAYAQARGLEIVAEYVDRDCGERDDRSELQRMLHHAVHGRFQLLLFWSLDRISRGGVRKTLEILDLISSCQVKFRSLKQPEIDTSGPWGTVIVAIFAAMAQVELELLRERTRAGVARARAQGKKIGRPRRVLSLDRIEQLSADGAGLRAIARQVGVSPQTVRRRLSQKTASTPAAPGRSPQPARAATE